MVALIGLRRAALSGTWFARPAHRIDGVRAGFAIDVLNSRHMLRNAAAALSSLLSVTNASAIRTYIDQGGVMQTAAANTPRIDWTSGKPELLLEGASTNSLVQSGNAGAGHGFQ